jgi:uncharacterized protein (TIGR03790 family)
MIFGGRFPALACWLFFWLGCCCNLTPLQAWGPENLFLVINPRQPDSVTIANHYAQLRNVPPGNLFYLPWKDTNGIDVETFRTKFLKPIISTIERRGLAEQIDCIVYSSGFPVVIDFTADLPPEVRGKLPVPPQGSLTGMTYLMKAVNSKHAPSYLSLTSNHYMRQVPNGMESQPTHSFRAWYGWSEKGELLESGGERYLMSMMLAVNTNPGNTLQESLLDLRLSTKADGAKPKGTIYFSETGDIRTKTRIPQFASAIKELNSLGIATERISEIFPRGRQDIAGAVLGFADRNYITEDIRITPGALVENLTSYGGVFNNGHGQPILTQFLRLGAAGSTGTIAEPLAIPNKFPHAFSQVHYARGCTLAEALYQSVHGPYQLLMVGDPLCAPWANIPTIEVPEIKPDQLIVRGKIGFTPVATVSKAKVDSFELYIDGQRVSRCIPGDSLVIDTTQYADGWHEIRVVGTLRGPIETSGRYVQFLRFSNTERQMNFSITPNQIKSNLPLQIQAECEGAAGMVLYCNGRIVTQQSGGKLNYVMAPEKMLQGAGLATGPTNWRVIGLGNSGSASHTISQPLVVQID